MATTTASRLRCPTPSRLPSLLYRDPMTQQLHRPTVFKPTEPIIITRKSPTRDGQPSYGNQVINLTTEKESNVFGDCRAS